MRSGVLKSDRVRLVRAVAALALTAFGAGCSADVARFDDGFYTGAVPNKPMPQASIAGASQPYPGSVDDTRTGSVSGARQPLYQNNQPSQDYAANYPQSGVSSAPIQRSMLAPPSGTPSPAVADARAYAPAGQPMPVEEPVQAAQAAPTAKAGWNASANRVTLRNGETLETLSNRYGVPVKAIMAANGLANPSQAVAGQEIAIPTYSYAAKPGANRMTANAETPALAAPPAPLRVPVKTASAATPGRMTVEPGDSLASISRRTGVSIADLKAANDMTGDTVRIGQKLVLPAGAREPRQVASIDPREGMETKSVVKSAPKAVTETAEKQPKPYQAPQQVKAAEAKPVPAHEPKASPAAEQAKEVAAAPAKEAAPVKEAAPATTVADESEKETAEAPVGTGISQFRWPVQGRVLKRFGEKDGARRNDGLNISVPRGTPVKAAENGVVIYAGDGLKEFGNTVLVRHDNGLVTVYGHADDLKVKRGETVRRGQEIATAGMSGDATSPMLHFEVRKNSAPVDPGKYLQ